MPCAGLCASALSFEEPKAGAPTSVAIQWSTSFAPNAGDSFRVSFNSGADADCGVLINEGDCIRRLRAGGGRSKTPLQIGGVDGRSFAGTWVANTSSVQLMTTDYGCLINGFPSSSSTARASLTCRWHNSERRPISLSFHRAGSTPSSYLPFRGVGTVPSSSSRGRTAPCLVLPFE